MRYSERITHSTAPGKVFFLLVFFSLLMAITAFGQSREERKLHIRAIKALNTGKLADAEYLYHDLLQLAPENPDYNYEMGIAIYEQGIHRGKAAPYFEKALLSTKADTLADMFLFAGKASQYAGDFDIAIDHFKTYMGLMRKLEDLSPELLEEDVPRYIEMCQNGKVQFENNKEHVRIENLGKFINSEFADYSPVVSKDENMILFTSRRKGTTGEDIDSDDKYFEDIYYSLNIDGTWTKASNFDSTSRFMNAEINTNDHDAAITYAADQTQLYIYREEDVWVSTLEEGLWSLPIRDQGRINTAKGYEPSVFITEDQKQMFVVSELGSGYGGRDIYRTFKGADGTWQPLKTLGNVINSRFDEDAPFLTPDGNTLYFASNGHNSMGDYDIFKSVLDENGNWSQPENLGPPINTPGHDRYFVTTDAGAVGYYASDRDGGYGETDIYRIILDCKAVSATIIRGVVFSEDLKKAVGATITVFDGKTGRLINNYAADSTDGTYEMRLKTETSYKFKIEADGYMAHSGDFKVPQQCDYYSLFQEIKIENMTDSSGRVYAQKAFINNAFFNIDQKINEDFAEQDMTKISDRQKDSLRSLIAENYNPIELTNYVKMIDILDPNGIRLSSEVIGEKDVAIVQARDEVKAKYNKNVVSADQYYYSDLLPEARAGYIVANVIDEEQAYPKQQMRVIEDRLKDAPLDALLATLPEVDASEMVVLEDPSMIDNSSMIIPGGPIIPQEKLAVEEVIEEKIKEEPALLADIVEEESVPVNIPEPTIPDVVIETQPEIVKEVIQPEIAEERIAPIETKAEEETIVFRNILFDFDKSFLREASIEELKKINKYMSNRNGTGLTIDGHADWIGTTEYNLALSEKRAKTAYSFLIDKGISNSRLSYQFFGEAIPIAPNQNEDGSDNPDGRQMNRRCEFKLDKAGTAENVVLKF
ncbi:OmpA family protein [Salibacteraceae bacterium]|nr:OmpA family protein [Salibacteraceae bacterium]MDB4105186.1 OmpA family protein [Salibacteraceae bacterium]MDB9709010.1 OmpA family protein [Salibacteraceae bacterium]MDC1305050.1 OmpA family protein [Salibacteraceae bacterium]